MGIARLFPLEPVLFNDCKHTEASRFKSYGVRIGIGIGKKHNLSTRLYIDHIIYTSRRFKGIRNSYCKSNGCQSFLYAGEFAILNFSHRDIQNRPRFHVKGRCGVSQTFLCQRSVKALKNPNCRRLPLLLLQEPYLWKP